MNSIAFVGIKGGNGCTTSAHLACYGARIAQRPAYFLHTDMREPLKAVGRPYKYVDARDVGVLKSYYNKLVESPGDHWVVVDSGGNRANFDAELAKVVDLAIIPTDLDPESVELAKVHAETLSNHTEVKILVRCAHRLGRDDQALYDSIPSELILGRVAVVKASKHLKASDPETGFVTAPTNVNNLARAVYKLINEHFNKPVEL